MGDAHHRDSAQTGRDVGRQEETPTPLTDWQTLFDLELSQGRVAFLYHGIQAKK